MGLVVNLPDKFRPFFQPYRYKATYGGRGSAKSHSIATILLILGARKKLRILCAREIQNSIKDSVKRLLEDKIDEMGLRGFYHSTQDEIRGINGTLIVFSGLRYNPETIKSKEGFDIVWVEEAESISELSLDILRPTLRKDDSELWFSWNPKNKNDPVDNMFRGGEPPPRSCVLEVNHRDNPWFPVNLQEEMSWDKRRDPDKYAWIWLGGYLQRSEARVFRNWKEESFETPADARFMFGADWGFSVDPTVLVRQWIKDRTLYIDHEAYSVGCDIDYTPFLFGGCKDEQLKKKNSLAWMNLSQFRKDTWEGIPQARKWAIIADSARPETISYMRRHGFPRIEPAIKGAGSVEDGIEFLKTYDIVVHPRCVHTVDEMTLYSWKVDKQTDEILPQLADKKNHVIDASRYAVEKLRRSTYDSTLDWVRHGEAEHQETAH